MPAHYSNTNVLSPRSQINFVRYSRYHRRAEKVTQFAQNVQYVLPQIHQCSFIFKGTAGICQQSTC